MASLPSIELIVVGLAVCYKLCVCIPKGPFLTNSNTLEKKDTGGKYNKMP